MPAAEFHHYPWQSHHWRELRETWRNGRLPQALLLCGPSGLGKLHLAQGLATLVMCGQLTPEGDPCGKCQDCQMDTRHPDRHLIQPATEEGKRHEIAVELIRDVSTLANTPSLRGRGRIFILADADKMHISAANALLKTLEEPLIGVYFFLTSAHPERLPPTVSSRCQRHPFRPPDFAACADWLRQQCPEMDAHQLYRLAKGAPLHARAYARDGWIQQREAFQGDLWAVSQRHLHPVAMADKWLTSCRERPEYVHQWFFDWVADLLRLQVNPEQGSLQEPEGSRLQQLAHRCSAQKLHRLLLELTTLPSAVAAGINPQLLLENLLISWRNLNEN